MTAWRALLSFRECPRSTRGTRGATMVEFALVAPIFLAAVIGLFSAVMFVLEVQVANQAAQAAARWGVAAVNFSGATPGPQCPDVSPPSGMVNAAKAAAGPFATNLSISDAGGTATSGGAVGSAFCQITISIPTLGFGGYFGIGPKYVTATAVDYVT
jgi:Flp pilus assembly pilin Flp